MCNEKSLPEGQILKEKKDRNFTVRIIFGKC